MTTFDTLHPRDGRSKQFVEKTNSGPENDLLARAGRNIGELDITAEELAEAMDLLEACSRRFAHRYQLDGPTREDIFQDTVLDMLAQHKRGKVRALAQPALINAATRAVASRYIDPNVHHSDLTARFLLGKTVELEEEALGRKVTEAEMKDLADDLRMKVFNPSRRPTEDFWKTQKQFSMDFEIGEGVSFADTLMADDSGSPFAEDLSELADTVEAIGGGKTTKAQLKREAWNHIARNSGAPVVAPESLSKTAARKAIKAVGDYPGGAAALAAEWRTGETTTSQDTALFAAFGDPDNHERERIVSRLLERREFANDLWRSSVAIASSAPAAG